INALGRGEVLEAHADVAVAGLVARERDVGGAGGRRGVGLDLVVTLAGGQQEERGEQCDLKRDAHGAELYAQPCVVATVGGLFGVRTRDCAASPHSCASRDLSWWSLLAHERRSRSRSTYQRRSSGICC